MENSSVQISLIVSRVKLFPPSDISRALQLNALKMELLTLEIKLENLHRYCQIPAFVPITYLTLPRSDPLFFLC